MELNAKKVHELDLHAKKLHKIEGVAKFKHLRSLDVSCNKLTKIEGLQSSKDLRELRLYGNKIITIEGLDKLSELCVLLLQHNEIASIGNGLANLKKLKQLRLDNNCLTKVSHSDLVSCGSNMTHLDLSHNQLVSVQGLGSLSNLEELKLASNKLTCPPDLGRCRKLQELDLSDNPLATDSLSPSLKPLSHLKTLHLDRIGLCDLSPLPKLSSLETLHLSGNRLHMLSEVTRLFPSLEVLDVRWNSLTSMEVVRGLKSLASLCEILLEGNSVCQESRDYRNDLHIAMPTLEMIDGVSVSLLASTLASPLQMRPLTPSSIGPTLRQMEQHFLEAELQLQGMKEEMAARFDLTRAKMAATVRESEELIRQRNETPSISCSQYQNNGNETGDVEWTGDSNADSVDQRETTAANTDAELQQEPASRPPTRCGSRAKLSEALAFAALYSDNDPPT